MESLYNDMSQRSLPGVCQGTSGADAWCDSVQSIGGRVLNRRIPPAQEVTAKLSTASVSSVNSQVTTAVTRSRRMKWSTDMNKFIMSYYRATKLETADRISAGDAPLILGAQS